MLHGWLVPLLHAASVLSLQLGANALLFVGVNMYGVFVRILTERSQRKAFLQARSCIEDRLRLEDENEKQVSGSRVDWPFGLSLSQDFRHLGQSADRRQLWLWGGGSYSLSVLPEPQLVN